MQDSQGLRYSAILHGILLLFLIFGLPSFLEPSHIPEPMSQTDRVVEIALISNVPNEQKSPETPKPKKLDEHKTTVKPVPATAKETPKPSTVPLPTPVKQPVKPVKPDPDKDKPKKPKKKDESLDDILKSVKETAKTTESKKPTEAKTASEHTSKSDRPFIEGRLTMSETDGLRQQFQHCWDPPLGAKDAQNLVVPVYVELNEDGSVIKAEFDGDTGRYSSDGFYRAAADSAVRAVKRCSPLKNLPTGKYDTWRAMRLNFDPRDML